MYVYIIIITLIVLISILFYNKNRIIGHHPAKEIILIEENDRGEKNVYKLCLPSDININNHKYKFIHSDYLLKTNIKTNKKSKVSGDSSEGTIIQNIRAKRYEKYPLHFDKNDVYIFTYH